MGVRRVVIASLTAITLAACSTPAPPSTEPLPTTQIALPSRQRDIPVDDMDPCALLTETQREALGLDEVPQREFIPDDLVLGAVTSCGFADTPPNATAVAITVAPDVGIDQFTRSGGAATVSAIDVRGQPGVLVRPTALPDSCSVEIDIAPGQLIEIQYGIGLSRETTSQDELCEGAFEIADHVMAALAND